MLISIGIPIKATCMLSFSMSVVLMNVDVILYHRRTHGP